LKLEECSTAYQDLSRTASEVARKVAFSGIALIWVFTPGQPSNPAIPRDLLVPGILIVLGLALDLLQYISGTVSWGVYARTQANSGRKASDTVKPPRWLNWPQNTTFCLKLASIVVAYVLLLSFLMRKVLVWT